MNFVKKSFSLLSPDDKKKFPLVIFFMVLASVFEVLSISLLIPAVSLLLDISYRINLINFFKSFNFFFRVTAINFLYIFLLHPCF